MAINVPSTGLQEIKAAKPDLVHSKFKREVEGAKNPPGVGPPRPPGVGPPRPPGVGPQRPPSAAASGEAAASSAQNDALNGGRKGDGDGEGDVGPPRPPPDEGDDEDDADAEVGGGGYGYPEDDEDEDPWHLPVSHEVSLVRYPKVSLMIEAHSALQVTNT